ncbi:ABC transporter ATP-binding protein [Methylobacterium aerolatum]|uniref:Branched-chain amino acid transport system ATP-binding protein n=1 Tax=Methylobacterium aerolatum TaxID=418708 RepID=A0ABU0HWY4_9HYPH|nr:ABC transporter ATP-binding protein [Methylobacterium aerolatum]MDQ0446826.1 branched-chain amino acid transport system ATP-binding protein [Methylobacterium aerolatum]GJD33791.1 Energy-coupling factor transporter ATP-binding protein EcfA3 [Methylobacterium aerolatum]
MSQSSPRRLQPAPSVTPGPRAKSGETPILAVEKLTLAFGGTVAFEAIDLSVQPGEIHAVIGPNGAGKSSLINAISGLYAPQSGSVSIGEARFTRIPAGRLAALGVARTFQNLALFNGLSVFDNVLSGLAGAQRAGLAAQWLGLPHARREAQVHRERAAEAIARLGIGEVAHRPVGTLPFGVQKRAELARALVARPRLLLLDEPMAGMTATEKAEMSRFIREAREDLGCAIVLIEHDIGVVMRLSDRVTVLDHGRRIAQGTPAEVQADPAVVAAYLGVEGDPESEAA